MTQVWDWMVLGWDVFEGSGVGVLGCGFDGFLRTGVW